MFNSFVIALASTVVVLVIASLAGYAFGRLEFPGRTPLMLLVLVISFFPPAAFFIPLNDLFNTSFSSSSRSPATAPSTTRRSRS